MSDDDEMKAIDALIESGILMRIELETSMKKRMMEVQIDSLMKSLRDMLLYVNALMASRSVSRDTTSAFVTAIPNSAQTRRRRVLMML